MKITVNSKETEVAEGSSLAGALAELGFNPKTVVVELNGTVVTSESFAATAMNPNDTAEVLNFVGGG